jgi:aspartate/glutamate racemase
VTPILAVVHFTRVAIEPVNEVFGATIGHEAEILNFLDEAIFRRMLRHGVLDARVLLRLESMLASAQAAGASVIVSSGSSLSPAVDRVAGCVSVPVLKVESRLAEEAVLRFQRVAVVVTKRSNIEPFGRLLEDIAAAHGQHLGIEFVVQEAAFDALVENRPDVHDRIVLDAIAAASQQGVDAVLLPQVSVARVMKALPIAPNVPVLSSAHLSAETVLQILRSGLSPLLTHDERH